MTVSADKVEYTLGPSSGAMGRHSKSGSAPRSFTYPIKAEKVQGSPGFSFTTKSGTKVVFSMSGGKLVGQGSGGRFNVRYSLTKGGN